MSKWEPREKRVEDIVSAAVEVFLEKGYEGTTMEAIAGKAGISKGGLYHHFKNKEEILYFANDRLCEPISEYMRRAVENPDAVDGLNIYIKNYIGHWVSHQKELAFFFLTMTKALAYSDMWHVYEKQYNQVELFFRGMFERGIKEGRLAEHNVKSSSAALLSALDGVLVYLIMNKCLEQSEVIQLFQEKFVKSVMI